jgi:hypothetical protein
VIGEQLGVQQRNQRHRIGFAGLRHDAAAQRIGRIAHSSGVKKRGRGVSPAVASITRRVTASHDGVSRLASTS